MESEQPFYPPSVKFTVTHCGTKNLDHDGPNVIAKAILSIGKPLLERSVVLEIVLTGIFPCNKNKSKR